MCSCLPTVAAAAAVVEGARRAGSIPLTSSSESRLLPGGPAGNSRAAEALFERGGRLSLSDVIPDSEHATGRVADRREVLLDGRGRSRVRSDVRQPRGAGTRT